MAEWIKPLCIFLGRETTVVQVHVMGLPLYYKYDVLGGNTSTLTKFTADRNGRNILIGALQFSLCGKCSPPQLSANIDLRFE